MTTITRASYPETITLTKAIKGKRIASIDLLRGVVMIIMALDHVRDYFHRGAFLYDPTDLSVTSIPVFFTRLITHYCAPVFVFLAGISAYLYGSRKSRKELSFFLLTRGLWLVFAEIFIVTLGWTFNPTYPIINLQVIWAIGICMIVLSVLVYMNMRLILLTGVFLIGAHNMLDTVHVTGNGMPSVIWSFLHESKNFTVGHLTVFIRYPVLPWIGIMATGYCIGRLYTPDYDVKKRKKIFMILGVEAIVLFIILRSINLYGDAAHWSIQQNEAYSFLSFLNVTKYPPSLLYTLLTLGPALIFLALAENRVNSLAAKVAIFGRVPMFYYLAHIYLIHLLAIIGVTVAGYKWSSIIFLSGRVNSVPELKGYGFNLIAVYMVWILVILILFPICKWFDRYKRTHQSAKWWLSYL